jgi:hypothetical protein
VPEEPGQRRCRHKAVVFHLLSLFFSPNFQVEP